MCSTKEYENLNIVNVYACIMYHEYITGPKCVSHSVFAEVIVNWAALKNQQNDYKA